LERAFLGFQALPEPEQWWKVLGFDLAPKTRQEAEDAYRSLVKTQHPDVGGDAGEFSRIANAIEQARRALG
jgi:curved DNA-binding protein CbpA